ncbi:MAG: Holliday junction branch migration protein RuvA [Ignavibacteria bacterium]|nr:Holliday junction branch migration protein RuvA [Ignavibacteria bacterium]
MVSLHGILRRKSPTEIVIDVNGVGYGVSIPLSTYGTIGEVQSAVTLLTYLHVREDSLQLFGFATEEERTFFRLLLSVSGIGPRMAQGILSGITVAELRNHILQGNTSALTAVPGVGRKLAERLILELREKTAKLGLDRIEGKGSSPGENARTEAALALTSLGYSRAAADKAIREALTDLNTEEITVEILLKKALRFATKA